MLQAFNLSYEPGPLSGRLFENLNLSLGDGEKAGLVGPNGAGKTKLSEILAGHLQPDSGRVVLATGKAVGFLPQDFDFAFEGSLVAFLYARAFTLGISTTLLDAATRKLSNRVGLHSDMLEQSYATLSLGERMRAAVLLLLCQEPDVLILDEPANHLDIEARDWLASYLRTCRQAVLMVSHDRAMLNAVVDKVFELRNGTLKEYAGNYDDMAIAKSITEIAQNEQWEKQKAEDRRLRISAEKTAQNAAKAAKRSTQRTYDPKAKAFYGAMQSKIDRRSKAIHSRVQKLRENSIEKPFVPDEVKLTFDVSPLRAAFAVEARAISKHHERELFNDLTFSVERGERVAIMGPNGSGKTTLLRVLMRQDTADSGEIVWAPSAQIGFLSQGRTELPYHLTLMEALEAENWQQMTLGRSLLGRLGIRGEAAEKHVCDLSVGERTKAELVRLLMSSSNVLILDEPTNHLDLDSLKALEEALRQYPGSVIFTSHDHRFVNDVAHSTIILGTSNS